MPILPPLPVERRASLDRETLRRDFLARNRPVVLSGDHATWRARWCEAALRARHGERRIEVEHTGEVYVGERPRSTRTLAELIDAIQLGDTSFRWKGALSACVPQLATELLADPAPFASQLPSTTRDTRNTLWLSPAHTCSSLHHDGDFDNLNLQISGAKLVLLVPPWERHRLHCHGSAESPVNPFEPDCLRFPRYAALRPLVAWLHPGDTLLIPRYWFHCVYAAQSSVNLSTHFRWDGQPSAWRVLRGGPVVHRALTALAASMKRRGYVRAADAAGRAWRALYARLVPRIPPQARSGALSAETWG
jgi:hypothetical protein